MPKNWQAENSQYYRLLVTTSPSVLSRNLQHVENSLAKNKADIFKRLSTKITS